MNARESQALCVFSASSEQIDGRYLELAHEVGQQMASRGIDLVSGGGSISTMGELARTVRAGGGHTTGVIPKALLAWEVADLDADELLVTEDMRERKGLMDSHSDGFLTLPGGIGTLEELLEAWVGRTLGMHRKPVVILDPWGDLAKLRELIDSMSAANLVRPAAVADAQWCADPTEALDLIERAWEAGEGRSAAAAAQLTGHPEDWLEAD
ncbi:MAG: TIGR00730 family Rossman fold protein [Candidatus Nanopelagicales bacterium]